MHDFHFLGEGWMMFFWWFLFIVIAILMLKVFFNMRPQNTRDETPLEILERRYAEGKIDQDEFEERKRNLLK